MKHGKLYANYYNRYSVSELATAGGGIYYPNSLIPAGFEISSFGYDEYRESLFRLSLAKQIAEKWSAGISVQYSLLQSELFEESSGRVSADLGITFQPVENLLTGLSILHFPSVKTGDKNVDNKHIASYSIIMGFNWQIVDDMLITGSLGNSEEEYVIGSLGVEYSMFEDFRIRMGLTSSPLRPAMGVGYRIGDIEADAGAVWHPILGTSMGIGLSFSF
jgi:hypothetical protein